MTHLAAGSTFPDLHTKNIHGAEVTIPQRGSWVHLQFRRFADCPICNLHLQSFVRRHEEVSSAGIREVAVFHSTAEELLPYQGKFPFDVVGDPAKKLYRQFGVETSILAILNPRAWSSMLKGNLAKDKPKMPMIPKGGPLGLPADFLISKRGKLEAVHYGRHADDHWSVDQVLDLVSGVESRPASV